VAVVEQYETGRGAFASGALEERALGPRSPWARLLGVRHDPSTIAKIWTGQLWQRTYVRGLVVLDVATVLMGVGAAIAGAQLTDRGTAINEVLAAVLVPLWLAGLLCARVYEMRHLAEGTEEFKRVSLTGIFLTALVGAGVFLADAPASRLFVAAALPGVTALLLVERALARTMLNAKRRTGACQHRVVAVGTVADVEHLLGQIDRAGGRGWNVVAACIPDAGSAEMRIGVRTLPVGDPEEAAGYAAVHGADTIAITNTGLLEHNGLRRLAWDLEGSDVHLLISPALTDVAGPRVTIRPLFNLPLLHLEQPQFNGPQRFYKNVTDRIFAAAGLILLSPLLAAIAIAIKLGDRGSVFFTQDRVGANGERFRCIKFRTMVPAAEDMLIDLTDRNESGGVLFKIKNDPRVTRVGSILRKTSLDELPQLINVLRGEMSLVGPRPPLPIEVDQYEADVHRRLLVKPGITGLWQVSGRSDLTWDESVRLDLYYVENWSPLVDLNILAKTAAAVVRGSGAY